MGVCSSNKKRKSSNLEEELKKFCYEIKVSIEKEIVIKNVEKQKHEIELNKLIKLFPRSYEQEKSIATQIVFLLETCETFVHINFIIETIIQQSNLIALYHKDIEKINTLNAIFQFLFWINNKLRNEKIDVFVKFINASSSFSKELKEIYKNDDHIPSKTKKLYEQFLPDPGLVTQFLDVYYAKNNIQNIPQN